MAAPRSLMAALSLALLLSVNILSGGFASCIPPRDELYITKTTPGHGIPRATETSTTSTTVPNCRQKDASVFCFSDTTGPQDVIQAIATTDATSSYTYPARQEHGSQSFCIEPDHSDIELLGLSDKTSVSKPEGGKVFRSESRETSPHIHADVEHDSSDDGSNTTTDCLKKSTNYNVPLRIGLIFVIMTTSFIGISGPIFLRKFLSERCQVPFTVMKQFGTGVIISTALIHLLTHAQLMFSNECLGELNYEGTTSAVVMAGILLAFLIESMSHRVARKFSTRSEYNDEIVSILVLETGILFHSILVGITLVVSEDKFFITLFIVIVFHQLFEGLALGTRIASIGHRALTEGVRASDEQGGRDKNSSSSAREMVVDDSNSGSAEESQNRPSLSMSKKILMAIAFALTTPFGMAIGTGILQHFNENDPTTLLAIGTLNALSAGILIWIGVVEMWAADWMFGGELDNAGPMVTTLAGFGLVAGMGLMGLLGKWT